MLQVTIICLAPRNCYICVTAANIDQVNIETYLATSVSECHAMSLHFVTWQKRHSIRLSRKQGFSSNRQIFCIVGNKSRLSKNQTFSA